MTYTLKERIGDPSLFCGRKQEMELLLEWSENIPREISKSRALLGRRKSGKTAIMQRLFNILWNRNGRIIPFYFEVLDFDRWLLDFSDDYFRTFLSQYLSFKTRTLLPADNSPRKMAELKDIGKTIGNHNVLRNIETFQEYYEAGKVDNAMNWAFGAPARFAGEENLFFLVMIDEIQFMTKYIFRDREYNVRAHNLPGAFHGLVESKIAPMLVSGSYIGWMTQMIRTMFVGGRLKQTEISPKLTFAEGMEAVYRYAEYYRVPITDESAYAINVLTQSDPFYIAALFRSDWPHRDFTSIAGVTRTLEFEVLNRKGELFATWSEYIDSTTKEVNDKYAKKILLFLSRERYKEFTRIEIGDYLGGELDDVQLEDRLKTLEYGNLITRGTSNFRFSGIPDDILDLIFRQLYQEEIDQVKPDVGAELAAKVKDLEKDRKSLLGKLKELKGRMLEFIIYRELNRYVREDGIIKNFRQRLRPISRLEVQQENKMEEILTAVSTSKFEMVWMNYYIQVPATTTAAEIDVLVEGAEEDNYCWTLVFEMKNRDEKYLPTMAEAKSFVTKLNMVKQWLEQKDKEIRFICPVYFSANGFEPGIETWLHQHGVFTTDMERWETA
ncbi:MAG: hypothetical protein GTO45_12200 [Candidatus Aminicenantes bacterium]|nr:hypothetical protein [Candidatus Aminicenantes bacterium]NIN18870.1 hypothetical protein [Candidatus Aminicenantes bacterium]NIN42783.1 hypothetical protein [Candidatus Aminicenantes bacterium]NIN85510.1 hypothetical protein [Candidatus Aminicenantes bacterium]NIO81774.1 hypothetical protein [Candidatus Aminicenantes bacterium]